MQEQEKKMAPGCAATPGLSCRRPGPKLEGTAPVKPLPLPEPHCVLVLRDGLPGQAAGDGNLKRTNLPRRVRCNRSRVFAPDRRFLRARSAPRGALRCRVGWWIPSFPAA